ncbi:MAG: sigma 54-interacting transcriptional regulator, partial [Planctomycetota bacterium]
LRLVGDGSNLVDSVYVDNAADARPSALARLAPDAPCAGRAYFVTNAERLQESRRLLRAHERASPVRILVESPSMRRALDLLDRFAATGGPLLITGETGCGKELLARRAHLKGPHRDGPWIPLNCAAIPPGLLESELFGHEKGAFTGATGRRRGMFELAHRGTLFLDEIGDLPMELQPKLLRVLESGEFFRIGGRAPVCVELLLVSATHRDLEERSAAGDFREDLFFRLSRFRVDVPPLRERPEDIRLLACHFLDRVGRQGDKPAPALSPGALEALIAYPWPGNVRELRNVLERACVLGGGKEISTAGLSLTAPGGRRGDDAGSHGSPPRSIKAVEEEAIRVALRHTGGRKGDAAKLLGISWPTLRRKLKRYQIDPTAP